MTSRPVLELCADKKSISPVSEGFGVFRLKVWIAALVRQNDRPELRVAGGNAIGLTVLVDDAGRIERRPVRTGIGGRNLPFANP